MSSDDDFGGLTSTTPNIPRAIHSQSTKKPTSRVEAGPSSSKAAAAPGNKKSALKRPREIVEEDVSDDVQEVVPRRGRAAKAKQREKTVETIADTDDVKEDDEEIYEVERPLPPQKGRGGSKKPSRGGAANGRGAAKGKGKAKTVGETIDVEAMDIMDDDEDPNLENESSQALNLAEAINAAHHPNRVKNRVRDSGGGNHVHKRPEVNHEAVIQKLEEQLRQANAHIQDLSKQLNELHRVRETEPELLMKQLEAQFQQELQVKDALIGDMTTKLSRKDPFLRGGKNLRLELFTGEEVEQKKEQLQGQLNLWKARVQDANTRLEDKEDVIKALEETVTDLKYELQVEITNKNNLANKHQRQPPSASRPQGGIIPASEDPKNVEVIKFYEDVTNIIIPNLKIQQGAYLNTDDCILNCVYSYNDVVNQVKPNRSLRFNLRLCWEIRAGESEPITSKVQLVESVHYTPLHLDREAPDFAESLGFLQHTFVFERSQLSLFIRTLYEYVSGEGVEKQADASSDDVQVIE